jgi:hypothetical protein
MGEGRDMGYGTFACSALLALSLAAGCSVLTDTEKKQCKKPEDCGTFEGAPTYACEAELCRYVDCNKDADCAARGKFICEQSSCTPALCISNDDCGESGETCVGGRCLDALFHCFDDKASLSSAQEPVLAFDVVTFSNHVPVNDLQVKVCVLADTPCNSPVAATTTYSAEGKLEIRGLENGKRYSVRLNGKDGSGHAFVEAEYYMQRPIVGYTQEADRFEMVLPLLLSGVGDSAGVPYDDTKGLVIAEIFGCDDKPLAGVSAIDNRDGTIFYLTGTADPNASETDSVGQAGVVNMEVGASGNPLLHKLTFSYGAQNMFSFGVTPRPGVMTFLNLYLPDYGSTTDRAAQLTSMPDQTP